MCCLSKPSGSLRPALHHVWDGFADLQNGRTVADNNTMSGHTLYLAKPSLLDTPPVAVGDVVQALLAARLAESTTASSLVTQAAAILRRALNFDVSGAYRVTPDRPNVLSLKAAEGLPEEFTGVAQTLPLSDYDQVADLPYNGEHGACYGDFFAPVVGAFGVRSWLVASLTAPDTHRILGAILLGSRSADRFRLDETQLILSLAGTVSAHLAAHISEENDHGLASLASAA